MRFGRIALFLAAALLAGGAAVRGLLCAPQQPDAPAGQVPVIRAETRLVLVDAVVTDKKGNYIRDLKAEDFRVWEDGKEQKILNCTFQEEPAPGSNSQRYAVFVFDYRNIQPTDQLRVQQAAAKFVDANAGPNRLMAVANVGAMGALSLAQNFTVDAQKLRRAMAVAVTRPSVGGPALATTGQYIPTGGLPNLLTPQVRNMLLSIATLAKRLEPMPGRKTVVLFTSGFVVPPGASSEMSAMLDACNRANVAIYPVDVGGLEGSAMEAGVGSSKPRQFLPSSSPLVLRFRAASPVTEGQGQTGSAGQGGGQTGVQPRPGGASEAPYQSSALNLDSGGARRAALWEMAKETGGLMLTASNDLFGAVDKIQKEQNQFYMLAYSAPLSQDGSCHSLKVKVNRSGTVVRARSRYCNVRSPDLLAGTPIARQLEARLADAAAGNAGGSVRAPFFYSEKDTARVNLAMDIPSAAVSFAKEKGKSRSAVSVLGVAYRPDGVVAARFSDAVKLELDKKQQEAFQKTPFHYEKQFEMAPGQYTLKLAFNSGGETFGKMEAPLVIEPYDGEHIALAGLALTNDIRKLPPEGLETALVEDRVPLVTRGLLMVPSATNRFKSTDRAAVYTEVYDPLLTGATPPEVGVVIRITDRKSGQEKQNSGLVKVTGVGAADGAKVTVGLMLPLKDLGPGAYVVEVTALDSLGNRTPARTVGMDIE